MEIDGSFKTIDTASEGFFKDRGSKFIGYAFPIKTDAQARQHWLDLKELHPKAVHWCYAYRLGIDRNRYHASDDGEPSGSAGKPILNVLYSRELTNVLLVVVRYFGGKLLGVPGLIHAYKTTSELTLDEATVVIEYVTTKLRVSYPYESMNAVMKATKEFNLEIKNPVFDMNCQLEVEIREAQKELFLEKCGRGEGVVVEVIETE
jgi:uncharacterized YigZ family protein